VAYDKSIELSGGDYQPVVRMDAEMLRLPAQHSIDRAQQILELFRPDVWEGDEVEWSPNCFPDRRCMQYAKRI
jgi:hypothetical protein